MCQTLSQTVSAKEKLLKEIKSATPVNTQMIRKQNSLIADSEKVLVVWIEDQSGPNIPLSQNLIQSKVLMLFNSVNAERGEEPTEEKLKANRVCFIRFKERSHKGQVVAASADVEAAASYPEDLAKIIDEGGFTKQNILLLEEASRTFIAREEKSMPGFKASKQRLTPLLGAKAAGDFKLRPVLIGHSENPRAFKIYDKSLSVLHKWNKTCVTAHLFAAWFEYFKPLLRLTIQKKKIPFKMLFFIDNAPGHPRTLVEMDQRNSVLQPMDQGIISTFKCYYLRNIFHKATAAIDDFSDRCGQSKLKTFWIGITILNAVKNLHDSSEVVKTITLRGVWKKLIPTLMDDFDGFRTSVEEVTADVVKLSRELELEVEPEGVRDHLGQHGETPSLQKIQKLAEKIKSFLLIESTAGEDSVNVINDNKGFRVLHKLNKAVAGFERIDSNFETHSTVGKMPSNSITCYREIFHEEKIKIKKKENKRNCLGVVAYPPQPSAITTLINQQPSVSRLDSPLAKRLGLPEDSD
uniref:HTH CENPB-type domain-containing protein n=1 Tax=Chlorocebus sabaeus TaxID=60711 RepID=A0A0D9RTD4_CHLSB